MCLTVDSRYNYHLSTLFSSSFIKSYFDDTCGSRLKELLTVSEIFDHFSKGFTLEEILSEVYNHLAINYKSEYIYKNTIANELLLNKHNLQEAKLFTEFVSMQSLLDVLIVNGTTTAYEIKTELDNLERLPNQLQSYQSMFDKTYVVTYEQNVNRIKGIIDDTIGILILEKDNKIAIDREAESNVYRFNVENIFSVLRKNEYLKIIDNHFGFVPQVSSIKLFSECLNLFKELSLEQVHNYFIQALRERQLKDYQINFIETVNYCLKILFLERNLSQIQCLRIREHLQSHPFQR